MTAAEFELIAGLRQSTDQLRAELQTLVKSVAGCQAASLARREIARGRPSVASAVAAWGALLLAIVTALVR
jgi:hypothetical protein